MSHRSVPVNLAGGTFQAKSKPLSSQFTQNLIPEVVEQGKTQFVLSPYPGRKSFGSTTSGIDRGMHAMDGVLYRVVGNSLYSIDVNGTHTSLGAVTGTERCIFADDGSNLHFTNGEGKAYKYDGSTLAVESDSNLQNVTSVTFLNNQFIYSSDRFFKVSAVGDGSTVNGLDIAGAESDPDDLIRVYAFKQQLYLIGAKTIDSYYNSGSGRPPFSRIETQLQQVGTSARHSVASTDNFMYWLGNDDRVYRIVGGTKEVVSNDSVSRQIQAMTKKDDAIGYTYTYQGENFYKLTFPTENVTFDLSESLGRSGWFNTSSDDSKGMYKGTSIANAYGKKLVSDYDTGDLLELDPDTFDDNGSAIHRVRTTGSINSKSLGLPIGKRLEMSSFRMTLETGTGLISGQGENPRIRIEYSIDGGRSFAEGSWVRTGRQGEHNLVVKWDQMISFYDIILRLTYTDPVPISIYEAYIDITEAGY